METFWLAGLGTVPNGFNVVVNNFHRRNLGGGECKEGQIPLPPPSIFLLKDFFFAAELKRGT